MENSKLNDWPKGKQIKDPIGYDEQTRYQYNEMEKAFSISQIQLNNAKLFNSKYEYAKTLNKKYDLILFDAETDRILIRNILKHCSKIVNIGGVVGFTSYMNYDAVHYDVHVGIYQSVNEFLHFNSNWSVDAIVLHELGFHEIYIKRNS
jgi:hypothetical protein